MKHTSFAFNQAMPISSVMTADNPKFPSFAGRGRGRGSARNLNTVAQRPQYMRSQSGPDSFCRLENDKNNNCAENWELELDNSVFSETQTFGNNNRDRVGNNSVPDQIHCDSTSFGDLNNNCSGYDLNSGTSNHSCSGFSEDWESDISNVEMKCVQECDLEKLDKGFQEELDFQLPEQTDSMAYDHSSSDSTHQECPSEPERQHTPEPTYCDKNSSDLEAASKAVDAHAEIILNGVDYRSGNQEYDTHSSDSKSKASDAESMVTSDDSLNEQDCASAQMDDLTNKLDSVALDIGSSKRSSVTEPENSDMPLDSGQTIGMMAPKLSEIVGVIYSAMTCGENYTKLNIDNVLIEDREKIPSVGAGVQVIRNPLEPSSRLQEIWEVSLFADNFVCRCS